MGMIDTNRADKVIDFVQTLKHTGDFFGQPFILLDWQIEAIREVYGTIENGKRKYKMAYLEIPKKNGKTELVAALAIFSIWCVIRPEGKWCVPLPKEIKLAWCLTQQKI